MIKTPNPIDAHVGARVRLRRIMLGMSQGKLGEQLGVSFQQIQKYEKGANRISSSRLQTIARLLTVPAGWFFEGAPGSAQAATLGGGDQDGLVGFLSTPEGMQLNRAFHEIRDARIRRKVIALVRAMAGEDELDPDDAA